MKTGLRIVLIGFVVLLFAHSAFAKPIEKDQAKKVATNKLHELDIYKKSSILNTFEIRNDLHVVSFYVFTITPKGFIIVSGDNDLPPVISYATENDLGAIDIKTNPLLSMLIFDLKQRLEAVPKLPVKIIESRHLEWEVLSSKSSDPPIDFQQWPPAGTTTTGGWLETNWTQSAPYNALCPLDGGGARSLVGCPATAMAQILNYHKKLNNTTFTDADDYYHNYGAGNQYWIDNDYATRGFPSFPQLNTYLNEIQQKYDNNTALTNTDKAALSFACGVAAKQVFRSDGSGTFGVDQARDAYIKFNCTTSHLLVGTDTSIYTNLTANMKAALPAHLAIVNEAWTIGHNIVIDGYNTNNYYHANFGWGGSYNNWYLIPQELPYSLTVIEGVVVDIMKSPVNLTENFKEKTEEYFIYPNPVKEKLFINTNIDGCTDISVEIYTITGQSVYLGSYKNGKIEIDLSFLKKGIYFINIINGNTYTYKKLVKD